MLQINPQATRQASADWYRTVEGVTSESSNKAIGIESMNVFPTKQTDKAIASGALANVRVKTAIGWFDVSVFRGKKDPNTVRLVQPQREYMEMENGVQVKKYQDYFVLTEQVRAQILRHVESLCVNTDTGEVAKAQAPAQADVSAVLGAMSPEQLQQLVALLGGAGAQAQAQPQAQFQAEAVAPVEDPLKF